MRLRLLPLDATVGHILGHNIADERGRKAFVKGRTVRASDLPRLAALGLHELHVAVLDPDDVHENAAAQRLADVVAGPGTAATPAHTGRVNIRAQWAGPLHVAVDALLALNELDGLTVATLPAHALVKAEQALATIKVIPFAVPSAALHHAEAIGAASHGILAVRPLCIHTVGVILVSSSSAQQRVENALYPAIEGRVVDLGGTVAAVLCVQPAAPAIAAAIQQLHERQVELIIIAGETSIVDIDDVTPSGIRLAGGRIEHYGAPVEPGNLLLLAYLDDPAHTLATRTPILGAPGCVRSRSINIVDLVLPRLMAGEALQRHDILLLGHGGLLAL